MLFSTVLTVNLTVAYAMSEALPGMLVAGDSSIIHISSTRALQSAPNCEVRTPRVSFTMPILSIHPSIMCTPRRTPRPRLASSA